MFLELNLCQFYTLINVLGHKTFECMEWTVSEWIEFLAPYVL